MTQSTNTDAAEQSANPPTARRWWVLGVMSLSILMVFLDNTVVNTALPAISRELEASTSTLQWVVDSYALILAGLLLLGGSIGDRFGRRRWLFVGMVIFGLAAVGAALSTTAEVLIGFRVLQGVGAALVMPATLSIITDVFPREERTMAIGVWTGVGGLGIGLGPAFGGYLVDEVGWAAVFWMHIPFVLAALAGLALLVPESRDQRSRSLDVPGGILATVGLFALVYAIIRGSEAGWTSTEILGSFGVAVAALAAFAVVELRSAEPMLPLRFFRRLDFTGSVIVIGLMMFAMFVSFFFLTQYFQLVQGRSALQAGLLILPTSGAMMVGAPVSGMLIGRIGPRALIALSMLLMAFGIGLLTQVQVDTSTLYVITALATFGLAGGLGMAPLTDTVMAAVDVEDAGIGSAVNDVTRELGGALGIALIGSLVNGWYRSDIESALAGQVSPQVLELARDGVGVATLAASQLPAELAATVTATANLAFVDAMTNGFVVSAAILVATLGVVLTMIPTRMRQDQATAEEIPTTPVIELAGGELQPVPVRVDQ
jgi:EmrB/QacA subfamily drug resistance transporter